MEATTLESANARAEERFRAQVRLEEELATLFAHVSAAIARWLELARELDEQGGCEDLARFLAYRCGITVREAGEYVRVAAALRELPAIRAAFARGELTFTKVRALTRVATPTCEQGLLELARVLTASQLERALRAYRRLAAAEARETHELEFVDYYFEEDGSLYLRARLPAEDGTLLVKALEAARERVLERRRAERAAAARAAARAAEPAAASAAGPAPEAADSLAAASAAAPAPEAADALAAASASLVPAAEPERPLGVEALLELARACLASPSDERPSERARVVVHVDAAALAADGNGRCELENGPVISSETARRLGCDAELVAQVERDGLPLSVGRRRRTVPPALRRALEARDDGACRFPGCERRRHLQAHHRRHWADGGETSVDNLVLLCFHHHRLVHEGGYTLEDDGAGGLRFRNRYGVLAATVPPRPPPASADALLAENERAGLVLGPGTNCVGGDGPFDLALAVAAVVQAAA